MQQYASGGIEPVAGYGPDHTFDGRSLVAGEVSGRFVAAEKSIAYELPREVVNRLIARNATFGALLFAELSDKLGAIAGLRRPAVAAQVDAGEPGDPGSTGADPLIHKEKPAAAPTGRALAATDSIAS